MQVVALDGAKLLALMLAGGIFALVGLWLLLRPQVAGGGAKFEIFGLKFHVSSAGILVFLIGAAFLAVPIYVPEKPAAQRDRGPVNLLVERDTGSESAGPVERRPAQVAIETAEMEPNDTIASANVVSPGSVIAGELTRGDVDFFAVDISEGTRGEIVASVSVMETGATLQLLDDAGAPLTHSRVLPGNSGSVARAIRRPRYYISVQNNRADPGRYSLTVAVREP